MTSLLVWFASDVKTSGGTFVPASVYIASDSRVTWDEGRTAWDRGKKVFASATSPEIFGYCGDTRLAALVISQVVGAIDAGYLFHSDDTAQTKLSKVKQLIGMAWETFPKQHLFCETGIVHLTREGSNVASRFWMQEHVLQKLAKPSPMQSSSPTMAPLGEWSRAWLARGSGGAQVLDSIETWNRRYSDRHTSRSVFKAFCETIDSGHDKFSGGPPQLASLFRIGPGRPHGVIWNDQRFFEGLPTISQTPKSGIPWRNNSFEVVDPKTKSLAPGAPRQISYLDFGGIK
jgi:hypothetical protein